MLFVEIKRWLFSLIFSLFILGLIGGYFALGGSEWKQLFFINKFIASTGILLIGISFSLGPFFHYFNIFDSKLIYRKYLGVLGALYGFLHPLITVLFLSERFFGKWKLNNWFAFVAAVIATFLLIMMVLVSNKFAIQKLGHEVWKFILRLGYLAYFLLLLHIILLKYPRWIMWIKDFPQTILPSFSLISAIFILLILLLRLKALFDSEYSEHEVGKKQTPSEVAGQNQTSN